MFFCNMLKTPHHLWFHFYSHSIHSPHQVSLLVLPLTYNVRLFTFHLFQLYHPIPTPITFHLVSCKNLHGFSISYLTPESLFCTNPPKAYYTYTKIQHPYKRFSHLALTFQLSISHSPCSSQAELIPQTRATFMPALKTFIPVVLLFFPGMFSLCILSWLSRYVGLYPNDTARIPSFPAHLL